MNCELNDGMEDLKTPGYGLNNRLLTTLSLLFVAFFIFIPLYFCFAKNDFTTGYAGTPGPAASADAGIINPSVKSIGSAVSTPDAWLNNTNKTASQTVDPASMVVEARKYLGVPFRWEGRMTKRLPGLDCLGLLYRTLEKVTGISWKHWSVAPSRLIKQLGGRQVTLILKNNMDTVIKRRIESGDVVFLLWADMPTWDKPLGKVVKNDPDGGRRNAPVWVWHTGIYSGNGKFIHASPYSEKVVEEDLLEFCNRLGFDAITTVKPELSGKR